MDREQLDFANHCQLLDVLDAPKGSLPLIAMYRLKIQHADDHFEDQGCRVFTTGLFFV